MKYALLQRQIKKGESYKNFQRFVDGVCMEDVLGANHMLWAQLAIFTLHPEIGDVGAICCSEKSGLTSIRWGIWGGVEETTGRGLVYTSNQGLGHRRIQGIDLTVDVGGRVGEMTVVGTLNPEDFIQIRESLRHGGVENQPL